MVYILIRHYHYETKDIVEIFSNLDKAKSKLIETVADQSPYEEFKISDDGYSADGRGMSYYIENWEITE